MLRILVGKRILQQLLHQSSRGSSLAGVCLRWHPQPIPSAEMKYTVAYASFAPANSAEFIADSDGANARMLARDPALDSNPSFSPDGRSVLFTSRRGGTADIYRIGIDRKGLQRLTDDPGFDDQVFGRLPEMASSQRLGGRITP
jgi:Tol biopolymer transport system component